MSVEVPTKDVGDVRDKFRKELGCKIIHEDLIERWIKRELKIKC